MEVKFTFSTKTERTAKVEENIFLRRDRPCKTFDFEVGHGAC